MKNKKKILEKLQNILWSYDASSLDTNKDRIYIITQVLNYGTWEDLKLLYKIYSDKDIKRVVKNPQKGLWFEKVLNFWCTLFNVKIKKELQQKAILNIKPK